MTENKIEVEVEGLDKTTINFLYELANERGVSIDELVEEMLKEYIKNNTD